MPDLMDWASEWLEDQRLAHLSQSVTLERRGIFTITLDATISDSVVQADSGSGAIIQYSVVQFQVRRSQLTTLAGPVKPEVGDRIFYVKNGIRYTYEVNNFGGNASDSPLDRHHYTTVINTDLVEERPV